MSSGKREQHAGERRVPGAGKAASARLAAFASRAAAALAIDAAWAAAALAIDAALISARLFFPCVSRTLRRLPSSSLKDPMSTPAPGDAAARDAAAGLELAGDDAALASVALWLAAARLAAWRSFLAMRLRSADLLLMEV